MDSSINYKPRLMQYVRGLEAKASVKRGDFILQMLSGIGLKPLLQVCKRPRIRNIIVDFSPGASARPVIFSAHYDVVKGSPGANDNASGVAVLLGLCHLLRDRPRPIKVVFFDREEAWLRTPFLKLGLLGSFYYAAKNDLNGIEAVFNLEFCGQGDFCCMWPVKGEDEHLAAIRQVKEAASKNSLPFRTAHIPWIMLSSDHLPFRLRGFANAVTLSILPSREIPVLESFLESCTVRKILLSRRPELPEPLIRIHSRDDSSSFINENSLQLMLSLLQELIPAPVNSR